MRSGLVLVLFIGILGCRRKAPESPVVTADAEVESEPVAPPRPVIRGPATFHGSGFVLEVPEGFEGHTGSAPLILDLAHPSGVGLEIWTFPRTGSLDPRPRKGCDPLFEDASAYRTAPGLGVQKIATCVPVTADGTVIEGWYGIVGDHEVHVEVKLPVGHVLDGETLVAPILASIRPL